MAKAHVSVSRKGRMPPKGNHCKTVCCDPLHPSPCTWWLPHVVRILWYNFLQPSPHDGWRIPGPGTGPFNISLFTPFLGMIPSGPAFLIILSFNKITVKSLQNYTTVHKILNKCLLRFIDIKLFQNYFIIPIFVFFSFLYSLNLYLKEVS